MGVLLLVENADTVIHPRTMMVHTHYTPCNQEQRAWVAIDSRAYTICVTFRRRDNDEPTRVLPFDNVDTNRAMQRVQL